MIRDLLAGYTDLEIGLLHCIQIVRNDFDVVLKAMFRVRGETARINVADGIGRHYYRQLGLENSFDKTISAMRHCVKIRNQYAHCVWWDDRSGKLAFANIEEVAKLDEHLTDLRHLPSYHLDMTLLKQQEAYYLYTSDLTIWLNYEGRQRAGSGTNPGIIEPKEIEKPLLRIP